MSASSVLDFEFKVRTIRCAYNGESLADGVPCFHLELTEELNAPWDLTSNNLFSGHSTGNGRMEAEAYVRIADGDIQHETVREHTVMDRLDGENRVDVDQTLVIRRLTS